MVTTVALELLTLVPQLVPYVKYSTNTIKQVVCCVNYSVNKHNNTSSVLCQLQCQQTQ